MRSGLMLMTALALIVQLGACGSGVNLSTNTLSTQFSEPTEKLAFLRRYVHRMPGLLDAEYHIIYQDNGHGAVPGPSDHDIRLVAKVDPDSMASWFTGMEAFSGSVLLKTWDDLLAATKWGLTGPAEAYRGHGKVAVAYPDAAVVMVHYTTSPTALP